MKAIVLASFATCMTFMITTMLFRFSHIQRRAYALLWIFGVGLLLLVLSSLWTPADLYFIPEALQASPQAFDLASSVFVFIAAFFGGILQLYNLADRGFSLRILIDLTEQPGGEATADSLFNAYSSGRGIGWMYQKRIDDMTNNGFVHIEDDIAMLTERGTTTARIFRLLRRIFRVEGV